MDGTTIFAICVFMGIPTSITAFCSWMLQRKITARDKARDEAEAKKERKAEARERNREKLEVTLLQSTTAAIALSQATARAVQSIPDTHCDGDMHAALEYAAKVQDQQEDFLTSLGIHALHEE